MHIGCRIHQVSAIVGANGLTLAATAGDDGVEASASHHRGCPLCSCRFADDGTQLALAAIDGRIFLRGFEHCLFEPSALTTSTCRVN